MRRLVEFVRDGWLLAGLTLLLFLVLEGVYAAYRAARAPRGADPGAATQHPYAAEPWWPAFQGREGLAARRNRYDPYRSHWATPVSAPYVNVDSAGRRRTVQHDLLGGRPVYLLGGSTMWGYTARDSFSIPSLTARELAARGVRDVEIVNLAQAAYNTTQELNTLILELLAGRQPGLAVFLNGYNDVATGWVHGRAGRTYGEESIDEHIRLGTRGFLSELAGLGRHSALVRRLQATAGIVRARPRVRGGPEVCGEVATYYRRIAHLAEAVGAIHGFPVVYFLQPVHVSSGKRLTPWEAALRRPRALAPCMQAIDSAMADRAGSLFHSLVDAFDGDSATVFVDASAHLTEDANATVARRIAEVIGPRLRESAPPSPTAAGSRPQSH
jgi:hypothetical protein